MATRWLRRRNHAALTQSGCPSLHQRPPQPQLLQNHLSIHFSRYSLSRTSCINFGLALICKDPSICRPPSVIFWSYFGSPLISLHISVQLQPLNACSQQTQWEPRAEAIVHIRRYVFTFRLPHSFRRWPRPTFPSLGIQLPGSGDSAPFGH